MSDEKRLHLLEKIAIGVFAVLLVYFALTMGLSLAGFDHPWPCPKK